MIIKAHPNIKHILKYHNPNHRLNLKCTSSFKKHIKELNLPSLLQYFLIYPQFAILQIKIFPNNKFSFAAAINLEEIKKCL